MEIATILNMIESSNNVHILYACEAGSRVWGFDSPDSDYDIRFIFHRPLETYCLLDQAPNTLEKTVDHYDFAGWDIKKSLELLRKTNATLLEWLASPIRYIDRGELREDMTAYASIYQSPTAIRGHYAGMALGNYIQYIKNPTDRREQIVTKKYLYVLNPLMKLIHYEQHPEELPPLNLTQTLDCVDIPREIRCEVEVLIDLKKSGLELGKGPASPRLNIWIDAELDRFFSVKYPLQATKEQNTDVLNTILLGVLRGKSCHPAPVSAS